MSLVAEGFTSVISLIDSGAVEAVIGVSCLDSLEKAFPLLIKNAVPGLAIPLNVDGCRDTRVDVDYVKELIASQSDEEVRLLDYDYIKREIRDWFSEASIPDNGFGVGLAGWRWQTLATLSSGGNLSGIE